MEEKIIKFEDMQLSKKVLNAVRDMGFEELIDIYKEQAGYLVDAGVDLFVIQLCQYGVLVGFQQRSIGG